VHVTRVDQVAIAVHDLDEALATYESLFGVTADHREVLPEAGIEEAMIDIGGVWLQLVQPLGPDSPVSNFLATRGPGLHHLGLAVRDIDAAIEHVVEAGATMIDAQAKPGGGGHRIAFMNPKSAQGVLVELVEDDGPH
jgi:methylmalonyl-CoA/ethylmalonyl-CoA epimerase